METRTHLLTKRANSEQFAMRRLHDTECIFQIKPIFFPFISRRCEQLKEKEKYCHMSVAIGTLHIAHRAKPTKNDYYNWNE